MLRVYGWLFALTGLVFVAGSGLLIPILNGLLAWVPAAAPLTGREPSLWLALAGSLMSVLAALAFSLARDPKREAAWRMVILSKFVSTTLCAAYALTERNPAFLLGTVVDGSILIHFILMRGCVRAAAAHGFAPKFPDSEGPFYEVWFVKANDPRTKSAVWLRYTLERGAGGERASCWYILFDAAKKKITNGKWEADLSKISCGPERPFQLDGSGLRPGRLTGAGDGVSWDLSWQDGASPPFDFMPPALSGIMSSGYAVPVSAGRFTGTVDIGGSVLKLEDAPGSIGHLWGPRMVDSWRWAHAIFEDGTVFEILTARIKPGLPELTTAHLWRGGRHHRSVGVLSGLRIESDKKDGLWRFRVDFGELILDGECGASADLTIALPYTSPDGRKLTCWNSKTGFMRLALPGAKLETTDSAAVEFAKTA